MSRWRACKARATYRVMQAPEHGPSPCCPLMGSLGCFRLLLKATALLQHAGDCDMSDRAAPLSNKYFSSYAVRLRAGGGHTATRGNSNRVIRQEMIWRATAVTVDSRAWGRSALMQCCREEISQAGTALRTPRSVVTSNTSEYCTGWILRHPRSSNGASCQIRRYCMSGSPPSLLKLTDTLARRFMPQAPSRVARFPARLPLVAQPSRSVCRFGCVRSGQH